jgi:hypothetical protein
MHMSIGSVLFSEFVCKCQVPSGREKKSRRARAGWREREREKEKERKRGLVCSIRSHEKCSHKQSMGKDIWATLRGLKVVLGHLGDLSESAVFGFIYGFESC